MRALLLFVSLLALPALATITLFVLLLLGF
jgi:hypothetical protein